MSMEFLSHFDRRLVDRYLDYRGRVVLGDPRSDKSALISYVLFPSWLSSKSGYYSRSHNNRLICRIFAECLVEQGYCVHITDFKNSNPEIPPNLKFFMGHNESFYKIANQLSSETVKVLLTAGSSEEHTIKEVARRERRLSQRKGFDSGLASAVSAPDYPYKNFQAADLIYLLGADGFVATTWYQEFKSKFITYNNVIPFEIEKKRSFGRRSFIYMSSINSLRRGLDLVLDVFAKRPDMHVYLCGPYLNEPRFLEIYRKEIFETPNIHSLGFADLKSREFRRAVDDSEFVILPSASEGQPGSLLNLMAMGLIPVATKECGITNIDQYGYLMADGTLEAVSASVDLAISASLSEREEKRQRLYQKCFEYSPDFVRREFKNFLIEHVEPFGASRHAQAG